MFLSKVSRFHSLVIAGAVGVLALSCAGGGSTGPGGTGGIGTAGTTGTAGRGGTTGAAGTHGAGGTTGAAGTFGSAGRSGAAGTNGATGTGGTVSSCANCRFEILAECQGSSTTTGQIGASIEIQNEALTPVDLTAVTIRYYFALASTATSPVLEIDSSQTIPTSTIMATFTSTYMQVGFSTGTLDSGAGSGEMQLRFHDQSYATFDTSPTTDYSYLACTATDASSSTYVPRGNITGYINGRLVWGTEPM